MTFKSGTAAAAVLAACTVTSQAAAQAAPPPNLVGVCSGVSLPRSVVTDILSPVVDGIVTPVQNTVNPILGVTTILPLLLRPLSIDAVGLLRDAAAGQPVTLRALALDGTVVGPTARCDAQADSFTLRTPRGLAIGGNRVTGLGTTGLEAVAGEANSIALGNLAATDTGAANAVALGTGATVTAANSVALGAGSRAARGALAGYVATGLADPQTSVGEVSVGSAAGTRQITNVAAGTAATDATTVEGVADQVAGLANAAVLCDTASCDRVTLSGANGTGIGNLAPGEVSATSSDAVNGAQLNATNVAVAANTTAIANLGNAVADGAVGPVRYSNPDAPTVPNGGVPTNDLTLVGAAPGAVALHNVAAGAIRQGSTDAVNGGQVFALAQGAVNAVTYNTDAAGVRTTGRAREAFLAPAVDHASSGSARPRLMPS